MPIVNVLSYPLCAVDCLYQTNVQKTNHSKSDHIHSIYGLCYCQAHVKIYNGQSECFLLCLREQFQNLHFQICFEVFVAS